MFKKLLFSGFIILLANSFLLAQPITTTLVGTAGRLSTCSASYGLPTVACTFGSGAGSSVAGGVLVCNNPCDSTTLHFAIGNLRWSQSPGINWLHGVFFAGTSQGVTLGATSLGSGWIILPGVTGASCSAGVAGGLGYYYDGVNSNSCCPGNPVGDGIPGNNYGVGSIDCPNPFSLNFDYKICNTLISGTSITFKIRASADGGTGCWGTADAATHSITFSIATTACAALYNPAPGATAVSKSCTPTIDYTSTLTGGCGNGATITWWTAPFGGVQVGSGSPFVYHSTTCPSNVTLYAQCCDPSFGTCNTRKAFVINPLSVCPPNISETITSVTQPTCTVTTGEIDVTSTNGTAPVTYSISPGGTSNTSGQFPGLTPGGYTITATDAGGCIATASATINATPTGGPGPTVTSPVNYCQNAAASPLSATGTNVLYYTTATGGTGVTTYTPSTTAVGSTTFYASQNPTGTCESVRTPIVVNVAANMAVTLSSAAATTNQTVCLNAPITNITYTTSGGVTGATVSGLPAGITGTYSGGTNGTVTITGTPTATGVFGYTVTPTGTTCGTPTATGTITVSTLSTLTLSSAASTSAQTVCINTAITSITYNTGGGVTGATVTGLPSGVTGAYGGGTNGTVTINGTPAVQGPYTYTVTTSGGCGPVSLTGSITVNPDVTITLTSAAATTSQTPCINMAITNITYSTANGVTGATVSGLPAGVTGTYSGGTNGTITISGSPTATGPFTYTITTTGGCNPVSSGGNITVSPGVTLTLTSAAATTSQTPCINTAITNITYATGGGATGATVTGLPTGVSGVYSGGTNGTVTISGTPGVSGPFSYTVTTSGGCGTPFLTGTINVNPNVTLSLTSPAATTSQTVCINIGINSITYATANGATGATVTGLPAGVTGTYSGGTNGTVTISGTPTVSGPFSYTVTTSGGCATPSLGGTINVNPNVTLVLTSAASTANQTVNINTPINNIVYTAGSGATGVAVTGLPAGVTGTYSGGTFTISGTPTAAGTFPYAVTTTGGCSPVTLNGTITVNNLAGITLTSAAGTDAQTICINTPQVNITYGLTGGATGASITTGALPAGVTGTYSGGTNGTFTISGTPTSSGVFNYTLSSSGGVGTATISGSITVNPLTTVTLTSAPASTSQTVCVNTAIGTITYSTGGGITSATVSGLPAGVTGNYSGGTNGTVTISGTPIVSGPFSYTVTTSGGCGTPSLTGSITVNPNATITLTSAAATASQTVCINAAITAITYTTANGATGATVTGLPAGVTGIYSGGTNGTLMISGMPTVAGPFSYTVTTSGGCTTPSLTGSITVNPASTIVLTSAAATTSQTLCINTPLNNIVYTTGGGVTGAAITGLPTGVTGNYSGGTNGTFTISGTPTQSGPFNYTVTTAGICGTPSLSGTVTVSPASTITLTSVAATTSQSVCINTGINSITYGTANGVTGVTVSGLPTGVSGLYSGGMNGTFTISGTPTSSGPFSYTVTTSGGCATASLSGTLTVNANVTISLTSAAATAAQTICINSLLTNIVYTTTNGATGLTVTGLPAGVTGNFSGGVFTISGMPNMSGSFPYTVTTSGGCGTATLNGTITVDPATTISLTSAAATTSQTLCINTLLTNIVYTTANGATGATVTGLPTGLSGTYSGGTNGTYTISGTPAQSGLFNYTVTTSGGCGIASLSGTITVTSNVTLTLTSASANATTCINTAISNIVYTTANGVTAISATGFPAGVSGMLTGTTYTISGIPTVSGNYPYTLTTSGGCSTASQTGTITVNANATISLTSAASTTSQTVCANTTITNIIYTTANGATGAAVTGLPIGVSGAYSGGTNGTFTISGTPTSGGPFSYTVTTSGGCSTASLSGSVTVTPAATITLTSPAGTASQTICINMATSGITYSTANGVTGVTVSGLPTGVSGAYAGGTNGTFTVSGTPSVSGSFPYTVITSGGCGTATLNGTITVNANVTISLTSAAPTAAQTVCINNAITNIVYTTANGATNVTVTGLPAGISGTFASGIFTISGTPTVSGSYPYTVTTSGGCSTAMLNGTLTVNPAATITLTSAAATTSQTLCINTMLNNIVYTTANGATGAAVTGLPAGVSGVYSGGIFTISGTPAASGSFSYTVTTAGGCGTASLSGTIMVNPNVTLALSSAASTSSQTLCINTAITGITYAVGNAAGATITGLPAGVTGAYSAGVFTISGTPTVSGSFPYTVTTSGGCSSASLNGNITVNPNVTMTLATASSTTNQTICNNTAVTNIQYTTGSGATGVTVTGLPTGVSGSYTAGVFNIGGTATSPGSFDYTVTTTGGCSSVSLTGHIEVVAIPAAPGVTTPLNYCPGEAAAPLTATGTNLLWYATATGGVGSSTPPTPSTSAPGTTNYYVSQTTTVGSCEGPRALIAVNVNNGLTVNIGIDTTICEGDSVHFTPIVIPSATSFVWRSITPGVPNSTITSPNTLETSVHPVNNAEYELRITNGTCYAMDTVKVNVRWKPIVDAGANAAICLHDSTRLIATVTHTTGTTDITYAWIPTDSLTTPGLSQTYAHPAVSTWYKFTVTTTNAPGGYGCNFMVYDSVKVVVQPAIQAFAGNDTIAMSGVPHQLHGTGGAYYTWSSPTAMINNPNSQNATAILNGDANFFLKVQDAVGCTGYDSVFVKLYDGPTFYVPSAFSPDGDGLNDILRPIPSGISTITYFRVYNRFGELMFETNQYLKGWDGTFKGKAQPSGAYVWMAKGTDRNNRVVEMRGTSMIIR